MLTSLESATACRTEQLLFEVQINVSCMRISLQSEQCLRNPHMCCAVLIALTVILEDIGWYRDYIRIILIILDSFFFLPCFSQSDAVSWVLQAEALELRRWLRMLQKSRVQPEVPRPKPAECLGSANCQGFIKVLSDSTLKVLEDYNHWDGLTILNNTHWDNLVDEVSGMTDRGRSSQCLWVQLLISAN